MTEMEENTVIAAVTDSFSTAHVMMVGSIIHGVLIIFCHMCNLYTQT